ncbi:hypothetical protein CDAR_465241 [Caerostris darwini]|uniref:Uncharacterized protein n=1 Tax=Caerostris darwini TaxID=1538125 RepID=A0AAV4WRF7_9ARAC|nr:hypothetical protein CDAR_465241 [Caerostris darwini]
MHNDRQIRKAFRKIEMHLSRTNVGIAQEGTSIRKKRVAQEGTSIRKKGVAQKGTSIRKKGLQSGRRDFNQEEGTSIRKKGVAQEGSLFNSGPSLRAVAFSFS